MSTHDLPSGGHAARALLLVLGIACGACSDASPPMQAPPAKPEVRGIRIEPSNIAANVGATLQFRAVVDADPGADTSVFWSVTPAETARITDGGLLSTCYPPAVAIVSARSRADTSKSAVAEIPVVSSAVGWAFVTGVVRPGEEAPTASEYLDVSALRDDVDFYITLNPSHFIHCRLIERLEVWGRGGGMDTTISSVAFTPSFSSARAVGARFATRSVTNGVYRVGGRVFLTELSQPVPVLDLGITVANP